MYDERFSRRWGYWRPVVAEVVDKFLACGILKHGFANPPSDSSQSALGALAILFMSAAVTSPHKPTAYHADVPTG